jgi:hypothetical protein
VEKPTGNYQNIKKEELQQRLLNLLLNVLEMVMFVNSFSKFKHSGTSQTEPTGVFRSFQPCSRAVANAE